MTFRQAVANQLEKDRASLEARVRAQTAALPFMPCTVTTADLAFGHAAERLLPPKEVIPLEFFEEGNPWVVWADKWFYMGLDNWPVPVEGIDRDIALSNLTCIIRGRDIGHNMKTIGVGYLASLWFATIDGPAINKNPMAKPQ